MAYYGGPCGSSLVGWQRMGCSMGTGWLVEMGRRKGGRGLGEFQHHRGT